MTDRLTDEQIEAVCEELKDASEEEYSLDGCEPWFFAKALTAIRQLQNPWMPIETAPRDGTDVDLWVVGNNGKGWRQAEAYWINGWRAENMAYLDPGPVEVDGNVATHWMPHPTPPKG